MRESASDEAPRPCIWGSGVAYAGPELTFAAAAVLALAVLAIGHRFSIDSEKICELRSICSKVPACAKSGAL